MPKIRVTVSEDVEVPEGTVIVRAPTGVISRLRLPDGTEIKPWTVYENVATEEEISHDDLMQMSVNTGLEYEITIEHDDLEEIQPEKLSYS
jgi:hypothetical protein